MMTSFKPIAAVAGLALSLAGLGAGGALAQTGEIPEAAKPKANDKIVSRRVCRNIVQSGSRLSTRVCRTAADWDKAMLDTQDAALQQQTGAGFRPEPSSTSTSAPR